MFHQLHRLKLAFGLSVVLTAVAAAPAAAMFVANGHGPVIVPAHPSTQATSDVTTSPCSEVCSGGSVTGQSSSVPLDPWVHNVATQGTVTHPTQPTVVRVVAHNDGFDWGDAAIGAGAAAAILLIIVGGAGATTARRGRRLGGSRATVAG